MCGRVRLADEFSEIKIKLKFDLDAPAPNVRASWNIPPTGELLTGVRSADGKRVAEKMRFGLIPYWAKDTKIGFSTFNARAESMREKPAFRDAWRRGQRCLVVTNGFYEWHRREAFAIGMANDELMVMAGLWDRWKSPQGERILSCSIITTEPNTAMAAIHDRMPVILDEANWPKWLGEEPATEEELMALLAPCPSERIKIWRVDGRVGNVKNDDATLAEPIGQSILL